jgi:PAS domain S-box-containing protein
MFTEPNSDLSKPKAFKHGRILKVVLIYALFGVCWILLSDNWLALAFNDPQTVMNIAIFKGWIFVGVTSLLLYGMLRRWQYDESEIAATQVNLRPLVWPFLVAALLIIAISAPLASVENNQTVLLIGLSGLLILVIVAAGFYLAWQAQQLALSETNRQSQAERLKALNLLAAIADSSSDAIFAKDLNGQYILFNRAASEFVGKPVAEVLGRDDFNLFPSEQAKILIAIGKKVIAENCTSTDEEVLDTAQGRKIFLATKGPLHDETGKIIGYFGISRDITESKQAEQQLRVNAERLQLALEATHDGLWDWDLRNDLAYLTPSYYQIIERSAADVTPNLDFFHRIIHPEDLPKVMETMAAHLSGKTPVSEIDYRLLKSSGESCWIRGRGKVVEWDASGAAVRMVGTITDISIKKAAEAAIRKQTEELSERNAELERFNRAAIGRELVMISLKQQINSLCSELDRELPYPLTFLDEEDKTGKV